MNVKRNLILVSLYGTLAGCYLNQESCSSGTGDAPSPIIIVPPTPTPSPSPTASPSPDPCSPIVAVRVSGPFEVKLNESISFDITPVGPFGPLEGPALDKCNTNRTVIVERVSPNLRLQGAPGFKTTFIAQGLGAFDVSFRVESAVSPAFQGTVIK